MAAPRGIQVIGEKKGAAIIMTDAYYSKPQGMAYCQAGEERFLRVISTSQPLAQETLVVKLASCRDHIELADPGVDWNPNTSTLTIHWLSGPEKKGKPEDRVVHVAAGGRVSP